MMLVRKDRRCSHRRRPRNPHPTNLRTRSHRVRLGARHAQRDVQRRDEIEIEIKPVGEPKQSSPGSESGGRRCERQLRRTQQESQTGDENHRGQSSRERSDVAAGRQRERRNPHERINRHVDCDGPWPQRDAQFPVEMDKHAVGPASRQPISAAVHHDKQRGDRDAPEDRRADSSAQAIMFLIASRHGFPYKYVIDLHKPFLPEALTPLFFTAAYRSLTDDQRLRYNQLQALYFNEQIAFFESAIGQNVLGALIADASLVDLRPALVQFQVEEQRHTAMFRELNRSAAPRLYAESDCCFVQVPRAWASLLDSATRRPQAFPLFIWIMLMQEERSLYYSRECLRSHAALEPQFVATHRIHLADEVDHVRWDEELIERLWRKTGRTRRRFNAAVFRWMVGEFFNAPRRAQVRVLVELAREYPELSSRVPEMTAQLRGLARDDRYQSSLYSRTIIPKTFARFDEWREFHGVRRTISSYRPQ